MKLSQSQELSLLSLNGSSMDIESKSWALWSLLLCAHWDPALFATAEAETAAVKRWLESFKNVEDTSTYRKRVG